MDKAEIEHAVATRIRKAVEEAISGAIRDLNAMGHCFERTDETSTEWIEPGADASLNITCAIGVGFTAFCRKVRPVDPVIQSFISRAESGTDKDATLLNLMEGDIANGGFLQLFENKGERFIRRGIGLLQQIGSQSALGLVQQALELIQKEKATLNNYNTLSKKLHRLSVRFWKLKESIPVLYEQHCQRHKG